MNYLLITILFCAAFYPSRCVATVLNIDDDAHNESHYSHGNSDSCSVFFMEEISKSIKQKDSLKVSNIYIDKAFCFASLQMFDSALVSSVKASHWANVDSIKMVCALITSSYYSNLGILDSAYQLATQGLRMATLYNNQRYIYNTYIIIGELKIRDEKYEEAIMFLEKAIATKPNEKGYKAGIIYYGLSDSYYLLNKPDLALHYGLLATEELAQVQDNPVYNLIYFHVALIVFDIYAEKGNTVKAHYWQNILKLNYDKNTQSHVDYLLAIAKSDLRNKEYSKMKINLHQAEEIDNLYLANSHSRLIVEFFYDYYREIEDCKKSIIYAEKLKAIFIEEAKAEKKSKSEAYAALLDLEKLQFQEAHLEGANRQLNDLLVTERKYTNQLSLSILLLILISVLVILIFWNKNRLSKKINFLYDEILEKNKIISKALEEKDMLLLETNHRIKNNFQLVALFIDMQKAELGDRPIARNALELSKRKVLAIARVHELLLFEKNFKEVGMLDYLEPLLEELNENLNNSKGKVRILNEIKNEKVSIVQTIRVGFFIQEAVSNSFQHAFNDTQEGVIKICFSIKDNMCTLLIVDDGVGFDFENSNKNMGLVLLELIAKQLDAILEIKSIQGTHIKLHFEKHD